MKNKNEYRGISPLEIACEYFGLDFSESKDYIKQQQQIMKTKKTFRIKLDTEFTIDFVNFDFSDNEKTKEGYFKKVILDLYFEKNGLDEVQINEVQEKSLFEVMAEMFNPNKILR